MRSRGICGGGGTGGTDKTIKAPSPRGYAAGSCLCRDLVRRPSLQKYRFDFWIQDCSAAAENMLLEAEHLGIGAVWLGVYPNEERIKTMRPVFDIPDEIEIFCLLSFGYPEFKKTAKDRWDGEPCT